MTITFALDSAMTHITGSDTKQVILYGVHIGSGGGGVESGAGHVPHRQLQRRRYRGAPGAERAGTD